MMLFVLGQSSDRKAILRNLHEKHHPFPARRPLGAKEDQDRGSRECFFTRSVLGSQSDPAESTRKASSFP